MASNGTGPKTAMVDEKSCHGVQSRIGMEVGLPAFIRHAWWSEAQKVSSEIPCLRQRSATFPPASCCFPAMFFSKLLLLRKSEHNRPASSPFWKRFPVAGDVRQRRKPTAETLRHARHLRIVNESCKPNAGPG